MGIPAMPDAPVVTGPGNGRRYCSDLNEGSMAEKSSTTPLRYIGLVVVLLFASVVMGMHVQSNIDAQTAINTSQSMLTIQSQLAQTVIAYRKAIQDHVEPGAAHAIAEDVRAAVQVPIAPVSTRPLWLAAIIGPDRTAFDLAFRQTGQSVTIK